MVVAVKDIDRFMGVTSVEVECDNCGESCSEEGESLQECMNLLKDDGWCFKFIEGHWYDFCCEACRNEYLRNTPDEDFR